MEPKRLQRVVEETQHARILTPARAQDNDDEEVGKHVNKLRATAAILESYASDISTAHEEATQQNKKLAKALRTLQEYFLSLSEQYAEA